MAGNSFGAKLWRQNNSYWRLFGIFFNCFKNQALGIEANETVRLVLLEAVEENSKQTPVKSDDSGISFVTSELPNYLGSHSNKSLLIQVFVMPCCKVYPLKFTKHFLELVDNKNHHNNLPTAFPPQTRMKLQT